MEEVVLAGMVTDEEYARHVVPHLIPDYFKRPHVRLVFEIVKGYYDAHDKAPTGIELKVEIDKMVGHVSDDCVKDSMDLTVSLWKADRPDPKWLTTNTEKFAKDRAVELALAKSLAIITGDDTKTPREAIPDLMMDALGVNFDTRLGHDYHEHADDRWDFYNSDVERFPFHISQFNRITNGGIPRKTLTVPVAGTNVGKTAFLCDMAANGLRSGKNILYVTFEMSEEFISQRVDANILATPMDDVPRMQRGSFVDAINDVKMQYGGRLIVKEYPNKSAGALHIRKLVRDLRIMSGFVPDIIMVDYLNICGCSSVKPDAGLYQYSKAVAEELRALAQELDVAVVAPTQTNRCLTIDTPVEIMGVGEIPIGDVKIGDDVKSHDGWRTVEVVHPVVKSTVYEIELDDGTLIRCTGNHIWPTADGFKTIDQGLVVGDLLAGELTKTYEKRIVAIREVGVEDVVDITVSGDSLFYANGVLTHNSGQNHSDVELENVAESHGTAQTADFVFAMIRTANLIDRQRVLIKQLKSRFGNKSSMSKFLVGIDEDTMSLFEVSDSSDCDGSEENDRTRPVDTSAYDNPGGGGFSEMGEAFS